MGRTKTQGWIDEIAMWTSLAIYAAIWIFGLSFGLGGAWLLSGITAALYIGMHVFEITKRHHCYASADSTAGPVTLIVFTLLVLVIRFTGLPLLTVCTLIYPWIAFAGVLIAAHVVAITYAAALTMILEIMFRKRIATERATLA